MQHAKRHVSPAPPAARNCNWRVSVAIIVIFSGKGETQGRRRWGKKGAVAWQEQIKGRQLTFSFGVDVEASQLDH